VRRRCCREGAVVSERRRPAEEYVVIRHRPGYKIRRTLILVAFTVVAAAAGYTAGLAKGGFRFSSVQASNEVLEDELETLRGQYREARQQLVNLERGRAIVELETRISSLKSDLTFYKNIMAPSEVSKGLQVDSLALSPDHPSGAWKFKLVLTQVGNNKSYISGVVAVNVIGMRDEEKEVIALRDLSQDIDDLGIKFRFRFFQNVEGTLVLPEGFEPLEVQVVAQAQGRKSSQAERTFDWDELTES
jgi:hypothetical protein